MSRWAADERPNVSILDLGSGQGASSWFLAREGFQVSAVDGSPSALRKAAEWIGKEGLPFRGAACCLTRLPFQEQSFDAVVDVVSSAHNSYAEVKKIFSEVHRVLKPSGKLFSITPANTCSRRPFMGLGAVNYMEMHEVESLLDKSFTDVKILRSSYGIAHDCFVNHWVVTATRR